MLDAAKAGDALAEQAAENMMKQLGRAAAYIACVVNPDIFVIGGGVSKAGEYLIEGISRNYKDYLFMHLPIQSLHWHLLAMMPV